MNERIKELAKQAGDYVNEVYTPPVRSKTPDKIWEDGHIGWNEQFQAKFAELIMKECGQWFNNRLVVEPDHGLPHRIERNRAVVGVMKEFNEHFGIEQ